MLRNGGACRSLKEAFLELMDKWGWTVNEFTDVEEEEDEEEDE